MSERFTIATEPHDPAVQQALVDALVAFSRAKVGRPEPIRFQVVARNGDGTLLGGASAKFHFDVLFLDDLWVADSLRGAGLGTALMRAFETRGRELGARLAWLDTMSWQARPFYEKLGYTVFGELPYSGGAHTQFFLRKFL
ncbi:MAG: GNAT family N-acetyltransferase [Rhizomicrobium sp.]